MLLVAAGSLWLFLAALPALADGGPHIAAVNSGSSTLTADSCAGCHRAHTAQGRMLLTSANEEDLCLSCHGATGVGATTDVESGVQYTLANNGAGQPVLGALRNGGFIEARIDSGAPVRVSYPRNAALDISQRPHVGVLPAGEPVKSAHMDLHGITAGIADFGIAWGNGANNSGVGPTLSLGCATCHNPHGNGQFRILNPIPTDGTTGPLVEINTRLIPIAQANTFSDAFVTTIAHDLAVGDTVNIAGTAAIPNGTYTVVAVTNAVTFKVNTLLNGTAGLNLTTTGAGGTVSTTKAAVEDSPLGPDLDPGQGVSYATKNYTVLQTKGTQGTDTTYMLYASDVANAGGATGSFNGIPGDYSATGGDYFRRNIPWNPAVVDLPGTVVNETVLCSNTAFVDTSGGANPTCATANDAPNGQPSSGTGGTSTVPLGEVAFSDQIAGWCSSCHTRYYANGNPNPGTLPGSSAAVSGPITATSAVGVVTATHSFAIGDSVTIAGNGDLAVDGIWFVIARSPATGNGASFTVSATLNGAATTAFLGTGTGGTATRNYPQTASGWWFARPTDTIYKYQHSTVPGRTCITCHVAHGSNAEMTGAASLAVDTPNGAATTSSRLLKIDDRGTCQACHDPTLQTVGGTTYPTGATLPLP